MSALKRETAEALVQAWQVNGLLTAMSDDIRTELMNAGCYLKLSVRGLVAERNIMANNALWDGMPKRAVEYLVKYGLKDKRAYDPDKKLKRKVQLEEKAMRGSKQANAEFHSKFNRNRQWFVVK